MTNPYSKVFEGWLSQSRVEESTEVFTVRKISNQIGVERTFPIHSPIVEKIEIVRNVELEETNYSTYAGVLVRLLVLKKFVKLEKVGSCSTLFGRCTMQKQEKDGLRLEEHESLWRGFRLFSLLKILHLFVLVYLANYLVRPACTGGEYAYPTLKTGEFGFGNAFSGHFQKSSAVIS